MASAVLLTDISDEWERLKREGNDLYSKGIYPQAYKLYQEAIGQLLGDFTNNNKPDTSDDIGLTAEVRTSLAKLYSNCAVSRYQDAMAEKTQSQKENKLRLALADGKEAVKYDSEFDKGHFRCALCLAALGCQDDVVPYAGKILELYKLSKKDYCRDKHLVKLLEGCDYFTRDIRTTPYWDQVQHKDNVIIIGKEKYAKYHVLEPSILSRETKVSVVLRPGHYKLREGFLVSGNQDVQILGDVRREQDLVTIECTGHVHDFHICHLLRVDGGKLSISNVWLRQAVDHPNLHAVYIENGGDAVLDKCRCFSKCSGCLAANSASRITVRDCTFDRACGGVIVVGRSVGNVERCTFTDTSMIGVEARDGGFVTVSDTKISDSGSQAIAIHAGALGATIERCFLTNNGVRFKGQEPAITCSSTAVSVTDCEIINNVGGGIMSQDGAYVTVSNSIIRKGRYGFSASMKGEARLENNKILGCSFGLCILYNQCGKIVMENNTIDVKMNAITLSPDDIGPEMIGRQHDVIVHTDVSNNSMRLGLMLEKVARLNDHFGDAEPWMDPRTFNASNERRCGPCGLTQRTLGTRFMKCSKCSLTWYCSKECQQKDWKLHKEVCQKAQAILKNKPS